MAVTSISDAIAKRATKRIRIKDALTSIDNAVKRVRLTDINDGIKTSIISMLTVTKDKLNVEHDKLKD